MNPLRFLFLVFFITFIASCQKENEKPIVTENKPVGPFFLSYPANGAKNVELRPNLNWSAASNAISYTLYIADNESFTNQSIYSNLTTTNYMDTNPLKYNTTYFWKIIAMGEGDHNSKSSSICQFTTERDPDAAVSITEFGASEQNPNNARFIQAAIDACPPGCTVYVPKGTFVSGMIKLKSHMTLYLEEGAVLLGTNDVMDYQTYRKDLSTEKLPGFTNTKENFLDSFFWVRDAENITITGKGTIDGGDDHYYLPMSEEYRRYHSLLFLRCKNIEISGITMKRASNWAVFFYDCIGGTIQDVTILGGSDGFDFQRCTHFSLSNCTIKTGDDCIAGCDNQDFTVTNCIFNTACTGFNFGCINLLVEHCSFTGPSEYPHDGWRGFNYMISAFQHKAMDWRETKLPSDNWIIRNITVDNIERLYYLDRENEWYHKERPAIQICFDQVIAKNLRGGGYGFSRAPVTIIDPLDSAIRLRITNSQISLHPDFPNRNLVYARVFDTIELSHVTLSGNNASTRAIEAHNGNLLSLDHVTYQYGIQTTNVTSVVEK